MEQEALNSLRQFAAGLAHQFGVDVAVRYDRTIGLITIEAIATAATGELQATVRSATFQSREQAEELIEQVIRAAATH
jgi:hypothetical protein